MTESAREPRAEGDLADARRAPVERARRHGDAWAAARVVFLLPAAAALVLGVLGGLSRVGVVGDVGVRALVLHGGLMVSGTFGTLIGLERAVALGARAAYAAPLLSGVGALLLVAGAPEPLAWAFALAGGLALVIVNLVIVKRQRALFTITMLLGAMGLALGNAYALAGRPVASVAPWLAFLVLTIAGERLELSRMVPVPRWARAAFGALAAALAIVAALSSALPQALIGAPLLGLAVWLARFDVARRTLRGRGLPRYVAVCLLSGFAWLAAGGALALAGAPRDAWLHAVLIGFVLTMVFAHAPIILPAILGVSVPYRAWLYVPLAFLHASLALRVGSAFLPAGLGRAEGAAGNAIAIGLFALGIGASALLEALVPISRRARPASR